MRSTIHLILLQCALPGVDLGFLREGAKPSSGSLKQGVWGHNPRSYKLFGFELSQSKV